MGGSFGYTYVHFYNCFGTYIRSTVLKSRIEIDIVVATGHLCMHVLPHIEKEFIMRFIADHERE